MSRAYHARRPAHCATAVPLHDQTHSSMWLGKDKPHAAQWLSPTEWTRKHFIIICMLCIHFISILQTLLNRCQAMAHRLCSSSVQFLGKGCSSRASTLSAVSLSIMPCTVRASSCPRREAHICSSMARSERSWLGRKSCSLMLRQLVPGGLRACRESIGMDGAVRTGRCVLRP